MRTVEINGVKLYELSKEGLIPDYLSSRRQQKLKQKQKLMSSQLEIIHDLTMPDLCTDISLSPDGKYLFILGAYKPRIRCYELEQLSMKFERYSDEKPSKIAYIDGDFSKFVILEGEKTLSFHTAGEIHKKVHCENVVRDILYSSFRNKLLISDCKGLISSFDMDKGQMSNYDICSSNAVETICASYNDITDLLFLGCSNGLVNIFDVREKIEKVGKINVRKAPVSEYMNKSYLAQTSTISMKDAVQIGIGTDKGMIHLYDIRNTSKPFSSRDLDYEFPVKNIIFNEETVIAAVKCVVKIWDSKEQDDDKYILTFNSDAQINKFFQFPKSGLFLMASDQPQIHSYFVPKLGDAPWWCQKLSNLVVDMEAESQSLYESHTFVTREELDRLGLAHLIGTTNLRAYMHGYYISKSTLKRAEHAFELAKYVDNKEIKKNMESLALEEDDTPDPAFNVSLKPLMNDSRFSCMFSNEAFIADPNSKMYDSVARDMKHMEKKRMKKMAFKLKAKKSKQIANDKSDNESLTDGD